MNIIWLRGSLHQPLLAPYVNISGSNNVNNDGPTYIFEHNPHTCHGRGSWLVVWSGLSNLKTELTHQREGWCQFEVSVNVRHFILDQSCKLKCKHETGLRSMDEEQRLLTTFYRSSKLFQFVLVERMKRLSWLYILGTTVHLSTIIYGRCCALCSQVTTRF